LSLEAVLRLVTMELASRQALYIGAAGKPNELREEISRSWSSY